MKLDDVGERTLLDLARDLCEEGKPVKIGVGDDAAAVDIDEGELVATTDMLIENIHFAPNISIEQMGSRAVIVNLSDLAAMGAKPLGLVYSIGAPGDKETNFISKLLRGMNSTARGYDAYLVGGDLNEAEEVIISGTAFGWTPEDELLTRSGARPGDVVGVTGELGAATAATKVMVEGLSFEGREALERAMLEPVARVKEGRILSESGQATSAVDITDGIAANLWQIARMSEVGMTIDYENLPISEAAREFAEEQDVDVDEFALYGGEDFELLFTVDSEAWGEVEKKIRDMSTGVSRIGEVKEGEGVYIEREGEVEKLPDRGYEHFRE